MMEERIIRELKIPLLIGEVAEESSQRNQRGFMDDVNP